MEPFYKNLDVYYKGFKLGRTVKIYPANDYRDTKVDMVIRVKENILPKNVVARIKSKGRVDYIELVFPKEPSKEFLKKNSVIKGARSLTISNYIDSQAEDGSLDEIKDNLNDTIVSAGGTLNTLSDLIISIDSLVKDVQPSLKRTSENLEFMSKNLAIVTKELSESTEPQKLDNIFSNLENTSKNLERATKNFEDSTITIKEITKHADNNTLTLIDCVIKNLNTLVSNVNKIVVGIGATLSKRFSGIRILFGKSIS